MNLLFVGDLRTAHNYGAIATTESLYNLVKSVSDDKNIKFIDRRSFTSKTPVDGFSPYAVPGSSPSSIHTIKSRIKTTRIGEIYRDYRNTITKYKKMVQEKRQEKLLEIPEDFLPYRYDQFEDFYKRMSAGRVLQFERKMLEWADVVFINAEGNIVHGIDENGRHRLGARYALCMAWLSKVKFKLPTLIVNHVVDPANDDIFDMISHIYPVLDEVLVRDRISARTLQEHGVNNGRFVPDALFSYHPIKKWKVPKSIKKQIDFSKPYICIGDSSAIRNAYGQINWNVYKVYNILIRELQKIVPQVVFVDGFSGTHKDINRVVRDLGIGRVNLNNCSYHDLYYVLRGASIFISGRWHASILSALASTPILLWGADSHKTRSLYELLDYPYRFFDIATLPANIDILINEVKQILTDSSRIKPLLKEKCKEYSRASEENAGVLIKYEEQ